MQQFEPLTGEVFVDFRRVDFEYKRDGGHEALELRIAGRRAMIEIERSIDPQDVRYLLSLEGGRCNVPMLQQLHILVSFRSSGEDVARVYYRLPAGQARTRAM